MNRRVTGIMRFGIGDVPILELTQAFEDFGRPHAIIPVSANETIRTLLFMIVPSYPPPHHPVTYVLIRIGASNDLTSSLVVPFVPTPSWAGLWHYLQIAHGVLRVPALRYELVFSVDSAKCSHALAHCAWILTPAIYSTRRKRSPLASICC